MGRPIVIYINTVADIPAGIQQAVDVLTGEIADLNYDDMLADQFKLIEQMHANYFKNDVGPTGPWEPLMTSTIIKKGHNRILEDSGALAASLSSRGSNAIREQRGRELLFGTTVPYARYHMSGFFNRRTGRNVPARPMVGIDASGSLELANHLADAIIRAL